MGRDVLCQHLSNLQCLLAPGFTKDAMVGCFNKVQVAGGHSCAMQCMLCHTQLLRVTPQWLHDALPVTEHTVQSCAFWSRRNCQLCGMARATPPCQLNSTVVCHTGSNNRVCIVRLLLLACSWLASAPPNSMSGLQMMVLWTWQQRART